MALLAFGAGLYGYLFPGNINTMMMSLYQHKRYFLLVGVFLLALAFEFAYCFCSIKFYQSLGGNDLIRQVLSYAGCALGSIFGCWILLEKAKPSTRPGDGLLARGLISIVIHPQQITFWLYVYALIQSFGKLGSIAEFALFDVLGCAIIFGLYMWGGTRVMRALRINETNVQRVVGVICLVSSLTVFIKLTFFAA